MMMKKLASILVLALMVMSFAPLAMAADNTSTDMTGNMTGNVSDDVEEGEDADENETEETEIEIEVEIEDGLADVEAEVGDDEYEFVLDSTDNETIYSEIADRTGLELSVVKNVTVIEVEESEETEIEIEVEIEDGLADVEAEVGDDEYEFVLDSTDNETIYSEIANRTGLELEVIRNNTEIEIEDDENETEEELEDDSNVTEEDVRELRSFVNNNGASMRLLQLEKSITRNLLVGEVTVDVLEKNHPDTNITELYVILDDFEDLRNELNTTPLEGTPQELAKEFVEYKKLSVELSKEFRTTARQHLTSADREEIAGHYEEINAQVSAYNNRIQEEAREMNAERIGDLLESLEVNNSEEIMQRIRAGNMTRGEVRGYVNDVMSNMSGEEKARVIKSFSEEKVREAVKRQAVAQDAAKDIKMRVTEKKENIDELREQKRDRISEIREEHKRGAKQLREKLSEEVAEMKREMQQQGEEVRGKVRDRLNNSEEDMNAGNDSDESEEDENGAGNETSGNAVADNAAQASVQN